MPETLPKLSRRGSLEVKIYIWPMSSLVNWGSRDPREWSVGYYPDHSKSQPLSRFGRARRNLWFCPPFISGWWYTYPSEKYESQLGSLFPIYGKNRKCSSHHQPAIFWRLSIGTPTSPGHPPGSLSTRILLRTAEPGWNAPCGIWSHVTRRDHLWRCLQIWGLSGNFRRQ